MARPARQLDLSEADVIRLNKVLAEYEPDTQIYKRALALKESCGGYSYAEISSFAGMSPATISNVRRKYFEGGLEYALVEQPRSGAPIRISPQDEDAIMLLVSSAPPEGRTRWTLRLVAEKAVENGFVKSISHNQIKIILRKNNRQLV